MLEGPLFFKIVRFALPLMLTNLLQVCYSAADMIVVGLSGTEGAIGAIGTTNALVNLILNIFAGFAVGTGVVVARNIGKGDRAAIEHSVHTALLVGLAASLICMVLGLTVSRPILRRMGDEGHILELATLYTRIYFLGTPFLALTNFMIAILRAKGDTRTPLYILTCSGLVNVLLNLVCVLVLDMDVDGVAIATVTASALSTVLLFIRLKNEQSACRISWHKLRIERTALREIIRDGLPAGIQGALFSLSNMLIQSSIIGINNSLCPGGSAIIDGNAAGTSIEGFLYTATDSVSQASVTFTSQNYGARKYRRIGRVMGSCYLATALVALLGSALIVLGRAFIIGLYVSDPLAFQTAQTRVFLLIIPYFTLAFMNVGAGTVRGLGRSISTTVITLIGTCALRIVWIMTVVAAFPTIKTVYYSYPISWTVTAIAQFLCACLVRKKLLRAQAAEISAPVEQLA